MQSVKVYEFKLNLTTEDKAQLSSWMSGLAVLWNEGNALMLDDQQRRWKAKRDRPVPPSLKLKWRNGKTVGCGIFTTKQGNKACPVHIRKPLEHPKYAVFGVPKGHPKVPGIRSKKNWHHEALDGIPSCYRDGTVTTLKQAWANYFSPTHPGKRPQFKAGKRQIKSLLNRNGATTVTLNRSGNNAFVKLPKMMPVKIKGFYKRFPNGLNYSSVSIVREADTFYIQFTAKVEKPEPSPADVRPIGVDPGVKLVVATSEGQQVQPRKNKVDGYKKRLNRLQRKLARQQKGSVQWKRTKVKIAQTHVKISRNRKAFNQKIADWLGRYDVAFEGSRLNNMTRKAKPKERADGKGYEKNGASAKSGLNRSLLDNGLGQIRILTEARCKSRGHGFIKTEDKDVRYSSQKCHCCGERGKRPSQDTFICLSEQCKFFNIRQNADVNAAKNHKRLGFNLPLGSDPSVMGLDRQVKLPNGSVATRVTDSTESSQTMPAPCEKSQGSESVKDDETPQTSKPRRNKGSSQSSAKQVLDSSPVTVAADKVEEPKRSRKRSRQVLAKSLPNAQQLSLWGDAPLTG